MKQINLFTKYSTKPSFWYPGSKGSAVKRIVKAIPNNVTEVISPFIGSGVIELTLAASGIRIYGYDKQEELINLWKYMLIDGSALAKWSRRALLRYSRYELIEIFRNKYEIAKNDFERAGYHWLRMSLTFRGIISPSGHICNYEIKDGNAIYKTKNGMTKTNLTKFDRLESFYNPNLIVNHDDFEDSLNRHPDMFSYCDPPYPEAGTWLYGGSEELDSLFDHKRLAQVLADRPGQFLLSYNDKQLVRDLYPQEEFRWQYQDWSQQTANHKPVDNEVLISKRK